MSTEIYRFNDDDISFTMTRFYGGNRRGTMVQINIDDCFVQVNLTEVLGIIEALDQVIEDYSK